MHEFNKYALEVFIYDNAIKRGTFTLASGATSDVYFDKYQLMAPLVFEACLDQLENLVDMDRYGVIAGVELGGALLAHGLALRHKKVFLSIRKEQKSYGLGNAVEGFIPRTLENPKTLLVEDVITTGGTVLNAIPKLKDITLTVERIVALITRDADGHHPAFMRALFNKSISFDTVFRMSDLM